MINKVGRFCLAKGVKLVWLFQEATINVIVENSCASNSLSKAKQLAKLEADNTKQVMARHMRTVRNFFHSLANGKAFTKRIQQLCIRAYCTLNPYE